MTSHRFDVFNTNVKILVNFPRKTTDHQQTTNQSGIYRNKPKSRNETTNTTLTSVPHKTLVKTSLTRIKKNFYH